MKTFYLYIIMLLLSGVQAINAETKILFLTAGQSNTDGRVPAKGLPDYLKPPIRNCNISYHCAYNPRLVGKFRTFQAASGKNGNSSRWTYDAVVYYHLAQTLNKPFYVVKCSQGGTNIDQYGESSGQAVYFNADDGTKKKAPFYGTYDADNNHHAMYGKGYHWSADRTFLDNTGIARTVYEKDGKHFTGQSLLKAWMAVTDAAIDSLMANGDNVDIKAVFWHQGESDKKTADTYYDNMKALVAYVRRHIATKLGDGKYLSLPFYCGTVPHSSRMYDSMIEQALKTLDRDDIDFHTIDLHDLTMQNDNLHFDAKSAEIFGKRIIEKLTSH